MVPSESRSILNTEKSNTKELTSIAVSFQFWCSNISKLLFKSILSAFLVLSICVFFCRHWRFTGIVELWLLICCLRCVLIWYWQTVELLQTHIGYHPIYIIVPIKRCEFPNMTNFSECICRRIIWVCLTIL